MTTEHEQTDRAAGPAGHAIVIPETTAGDVGITLTELLASFYLWLLLWLVVWAAVPALVIGWQPVLITSGSMGPGISPGDLVMLTDPPEDELLRPGAVITFRDPMVDGGLITHRVDGLREDGEYRTRGDANDMPDPFSVHPDDIVGVGRMLVPLVGLPVLWLRGDLVSFGLFIAGTLAAAVAATTTHRAGARRGRGLASRAGQQSDEEPA